MSPNTRTIQLWGVAFAFAVTAILVISPVFSTPFSGDDAFNSYLDGWRLAHHASFFATFQAEFVEWDVGRGRFIPMLQLVNVLQYHFGHEALPLKILQGILIAANVMLLFAAVYEISGSARAAIAANTVAILTLQSRNFYDAIAQYNAHLPVGVAFALAAVLFTSRSARLESRQTYWWGVAFFAFAALTYEIFALLVLPLSYIASRKSGWSAAGFKKSLPLIFIVLVQGFALFAIRHMSPQPPDSAYVPRVLSNEFLPTVWRQLVGTIPFSYVGLDPQSIFRNHPRWWQHLSYAGVLAGLAGATTLGVSAKLSARGRQAPNLMFSLFLTGGMLAVGPALLLAASPFYQRTVSLGLPYITVYAQGFGLAMVCGGITGAFSQKRVLPILRITAVAAFGSACFVLYSANLVAMDGFATWGFPRETIVQGLTHGAAVTVPSGALVFLDGSYIVNDRLDDKSLWSNRWFYRLFANRIWRTTSMASEDTTTFHDAWELRSLRSTKTEGVLIIERISREYLRPSLLRATIAERGEPLAPRPRLLGNAFASRDFTPLPTRSGYALYDFEPHCKLLPTTALVQNSPSLAQVEFGSGFNVEENSGATSFRWSGSHGELLLRNSSAHSISTRLSAEISTAAQARGMVSIEVPHASTIKARISSERLRLTVYLTVPARSVGIVKFTAAAPNVALPGDGRDLRFRLSDVSLRDVGGCAAADEVDRSLSVRSGESSRAAAEVN